MTTQQQHPQAPAFPRAASEPWYRHRWPWFLMLGPVLVMVGTAIAVWLGSRQPDAMVVDDYYKQGKAINQDLSRDRAASRLQLAFEARHDAQQGMLVGQLRSADGPVQEPFHIRLAHPTLPYKDLVLEALPTGDGSFKARLPELEATHWRVMVEGPGRAWRLARSWSPAQQPTLSIQADPL